MRRKLLFVITTFVLSLISSSQALAQDLAQDLRWTGKSLSEIAAGNQVYFYLYNVGKKKFLTQGGLWGTGTEVSESGLLMQALEDAGSGKYYVKTNLQMEGVNTANAGYLNFADSVDIKNDTGHFFLDQGTFPCGRWNITLVSGKVYTLSVNITGDGSPYKGKTYYLSAKPSSLEVVPTESVDDKYSQWMFVTLEEIKADFKNADNASISNPTPSSFFFSDPGFYRKDLGISHWTITSSTTPLSINETNKPLSSDGSVVSVNDNILPTNAIGSQTPTYIYDLTCYYYDWFSRPKTFHTVEISNPGPLHNLTNGSVKLTNEEEFIECKETHNPELAYQVLTLKEITSGPSGYTYYIGNGYILDGRQGENRDSDLNESVSNWQSPYGKDWTANIHGSSGIIQQTISSGTDGWIPGWYKVTCKGFSTDGTGKLFAYSGDTPNTENTSDEYQIATFITPTEIPATYVKASRLINDGTAAFEQSVLVYVAEGKSLTFGVKVEGGNVNSWTCFDSFTLGYCGKGENNLIIDEQQTAKDYLNAQVIANKNQILRLRRTLKQGQWNSLVLPVNLNAEQVTTAFGGSTKLAKLNGAKDNRIYFELVSLDDKEAKAIKADSLYIINPEKEMPTGQPEMIHRTMENITIRDYYTINQVTFSKALEATKVQSTLVEGASSDRGQMNMVGTYVAIPKTEGAQNPIPANSYVLSGGKWWFVTNGVNSVLGLRGWIEAGKNPTSSSKNLIFNIDGVDEEEVSTGIDGLFVDGAETNTSISKTGVYSLSGQKISDKTNLPKGIYIVNGRKMIVK